MDDNQKEKTADKELEAGHFEKAADLYGEAMRPFKSYKEMVRLAKKQMNAARRAWGW